MHSASETNETATEAGAHAGVLPSPARSDAARSRDAVVTGLGAVSPVGVGVEAYIDGLRTGVAGVRRLDMPEAERARLRSRVAALCAGFDPAPAMSSGDRKRLPRMMPMALAAAREAAAMAALPLTPAGQGSDASDNSATLDEAALDAARRIGVALGTGAGGIDFTLDQAHTAYTPDAGGRRRNPSLWTITNATHGNLAGELSIRLGARGPSMCVSDGCASSSDAIGLALELLRSDRPGSPEVMIVVGADAHVRWETLLGMELLGVISTRDPDEAGEDPASMCRPFDATRDGFVLGEGAWALVLETPAHAAARGARELGRVLGFGATCDAYHRVIPDPDPREGARAIVDALADAQVSAADVGVVQYHGTGTPTNDALETRMVKLALGEAAAQRLQGSSIKGAIGHPQGACGAASAVAMLGALSGPGGGFGKAPFVPPTLNLREPDPACDLCYTPGASEAARSRVALVNCLAFGAKNSALVVEAG